MQLNEEDMHYLSESKSFQPQPYFDIEDTRSLKLTKVNISRRQNLPIVQKALSLLCLGTGRFHHIPQQPLGASQIRQRQCYGGRNRASLQGSGLQETMAPHN